MPRNFNRLAVGAALVAAAAAGGQADAQTRFSRYGLSNYGMPGMIDMPTATLLPDGTLAMSVTAMPGTQRVTLAFQALPRVTVSFRYSALEHAGYFSDVGVRTLHDRSFDIHWQVMEQGRYMPAVAIGLRDFIGTGAYSGEYVVATRQFTPQLRASLGMGWGRLATHGSFTNPLALIHDGFRHRPGYDSSSLGGQFSFNRYFRGPAALFAGVEYQATDRLTLMAEYSSDAYVQERRLIAHRTPINLGFRYRIGQASSVSGYLLHGSTLGIAASFALNPAEPSMGGVRVSAPTPVRLRAAPPADGAFPTAWAEGQGLAPRLRAALLPALEAEGVRLDGVEIEARRVVVRVTNRRHEVLPRALGRTARVLTHALPPSVEEIVVIPMHGGTAGTAVTFRRSDLERGENAVDGSARLLASARFDDPLGFPGVNHLWQPLAEGRSRFEWSVGPYLSTSYFDPESPIRADLGLQASLRYNFAENLSASLNVSQLAWGNIGDSRMGPISVEGTRFHQVRTQQALYSNDRPTVRRMTLDYTMRPGRDLYGRVSVGWLERMYAGISTELLWSRPDSRLALGVELNHVGQRDPNSLLGLNSLRLNSGHVSAYYDFGGGFHGQLDVGQYLAGDRGATVRLERVFANGLRVGAYATLTDMPFAVFGEGSFDKGISITIPVAALLGNATVSTYSTTIRSITRDGGAFLNVSGRLYPTIQDSRTQALRRGWGAVLQ